MKNIAIYHFAERSHCNQLLEKIDQPLCLQNYSAAMFHYHTEVMIEIQHGCQFVLVI